MKRLLVPLFAYLLYKKGAITGISFVDSTSIKVCHNKRISRNKVFKSVAKRGKTTSGWFYGFKLHLIINDRGEIVSFLLTGANSADVRMLETLSRGLWGKLFGDKGYISSEIGKKLLDTGIRSNMKQRLMHLQDKLLLRKRALIETVNDQLKNISQIEHTRHRSITNFIINFYLTSSCIKPKTQVVRKKAIWRTFCETQNRCLNSKEGANRSPDFNSLIWNF